jgi:cobaltochelatase CobN
LRRIDAWLCDLKDLAVKDGLHVYGRALAGTDDPQWPASAHAERAALIAALDGRRIAPGPAGAPTRGRRDVLPTGRNLFTADPRTLPTQTAMDLGRLAADEVLRAHLQTHGEPPRAVVIDLWGSATLRTGGEEIAQGLALMGCRPIWDHASGRVTGVEVLPTAAMGRARVDVTWRISGLFRDLFPAQIALLDAAVQAVAARDETADENPLVSARRANGAAKLDRIFGTAPGAYGSGIEDLLRREANTETIGKAYLAATSHSYGGAAGEGTDVPGAFAQRVAGADLLVHPGDDPGRDLLEGAEDVAFVGGFAAAAKMLGRAADLVMLDLTDPQRPRARSLSAALARIVRARAVNPRFIAGQMRHGQRGAAELAETVDRLVAFAETTGAVASELFDLLHEAYVADGDVRAFLLRENPQAAAAIADRLDAARRRGFWHPRRNDIDAGLAALRAEAMA